MYWTFVMKKYFFDEFKEHKEIIWNSPKDIKNGDIIFVYSTTPRKHIDFILKAISDSYKDPEKDNLLVKVQKRIEILKPIELQELKNNPILSKWAPINKKSFIFQGAHHKMSNTEFVELSRLIIEKNPDLKDQFENEIYSDENSLVRAHDLNISKNVWLLSPGENAAYWDEFKKNNIITIGWGNLGDLNQFGGDNNKILNALEKKYPKKSEIYNAPDSNKKSKQTNNAKALLDFSNEMKIGDIVFIKKGINTLLGVGIITSDYKFSKESKIPSEIIKTRSE